ncbi:hypothetical protein B5E65_15550 [Gemmiger sp. An120]|uniref:GH25 family lysozyme n=1 Tax=Gemmiger sp. An120 TaxID=1965549 RepID=UPI000B39840F|nr:GH25 family lysozyme [Gemmiger sp. An120]OUQ38520.1 hypothetical protein B5E65_15550 [Gemmiger sp. An120]
MKKGLDISKHQAYFAAKTAASQGISTVICRCAYGTGKDICWDTFAPAVQAAGMQLGAYGFMTAHYTSKASSFAQAQAVMRQQVQAWIDLCKVKGCQMLAVDQELEKGNTMLLGKAYNTRLLQEAVAMIRAAGLTPIIYTGASWCLSYIDWQAIDADFWVAYYPSSAAASDFAAYSDGSYPGGQYGDLLRALQAAGKLWGWQYGSTGHGIKYGAGSVNIDRNWIYKEVDKNMTFEPLTGKQLVVTSEKSPACQAFGSPDVNDSNYKNLALGTYNIIAMGGSITIGGMTAPWVQLADGYYCLALSDRCRIEDKPAEPQTPAVDLTEVLASLARIEAAQSRIETNQAAQGAQLTALQDKLTATGAALAGK